MITLTPGRKNPAAYTSSVMANAAYKQSWRDIFIPDRGGMPEKPKRPGQACGKCRSRGNPKEQDSHRHLQKPPQKTLRLLHIFHKPGGDSSLSQAERKI